MWGGRDEEGERDWDLVMGWGEEEMLIGRSEGERKKDRQIQQRWTEK